MENRYDIKDQCADTISYTEISELFTVVFGKYSSVESL